jgi:hypothetical protein
LPSREPPVSHLADAAIVGLPTPIFSDRRDNYHDHPVTDLGPYCEGIEMLG